MSKFRGHVTASVLEMPGKSAQSLALRRAGGFFEASVCIYSSHYIRTTRRAAS